MIERLIDHYYEWKSGPLGHLPMGGVAMHPDTHTQASVDFYNLLHGLQPECRDLDSFMGLRVVKTATVERGKIRIIPAGRLESDFHEQARPAWPTVFRLPAVYLDTLSEQ